MPGFGLAPNPDFMAPTFALEVEGSEVDSGISQMIESVEFEHADGMADMCRIRAVNPDFMLSNAKVFQPGNELKVWMGYGSEVEYIGRAIIAKQAPNFPQSGMPTIQAVGYTKDTFMMKNEPVKVKATTVRRKKKRKPKPGDDGSRVFNDSRFSDAVKARGKYYDFILDVDDTPDQPHQFIQKTGISDYEFVMGLANITGYVFWVDGDEDAALWTLHFKKPGSLSDYQDKEYTFMYNLQDSSTLLSFQPEFLVNDSITDMEVIVKDKRTGEILIAEVGEEKEDSPDLQATGDLAGEITDELSSASAVKLFFNNFSFRVNTDRRFKTQVEVEEWAKQWFRRMRENFVMSRGRLIGVGNLRARQTHKLEGVGALYDGKYYFTKTKHICSKNDGYIIDFAARKVVP